MSVLTTADNRAGIFRQSVESVLAQTFADFELLIVIDNSARETERVLREYRDPRIRLISAGRSLGVAESRDLGAAAARGEYLAALDGGDLARPTRLARQVAFLDSHPDTVLVASGNHDFELGRMRPGEATGSGPSWLIELLLL
ncbi:MAG: glycosyltransferase family 2 protein, partial [Acetobacteraceae bacterium]